MKVRLLIYGVTLVCAIAGVSFILDGISTYRAFPGDEPASPAPGRPSSPAPVPARPVQKDHGVIVRRNLFGESPAALAAKAAARPASPKVSPGTSAPPVVPSGAVFRLVGTTVFPGGGRFVIIEDRASKVQYVHRQGEKIRGTLIQEVQPGSVRLVTGSRVDVLRVFDEEEKVPANVRGMRPAATPSGVPLHRTDEGTRPILRYLSRAALENTLRAEADLRRQIRVERYRQADGEEGVRIFPLVPQGVMTLLGLQAGDVVVSVEGAPVRDPLDLFRQMGAMLSKPQAEVEVLRAGQKTRMSFRIQG